MERLWENKQRYAIPCGLRSVIKEIKTFCIAESKVFGAFSR